MTIVAATVAGLTATADIRSVALAWTEDDPHANRGGLSYKAIDKVEVHASQTNDRTTATKVAEGRKTATHATGDERQTWYYWIKPRLADPTATTYGDWYPSGANAGVSSKTSAASDAAYALQNGKLSVVHSGNTLVCSILTLGGNTPSSSDPVLTHFPNTTGGYDLFRITAATTLTISSGSTLGANANDPTRVWFLLFNDSGTPRLGAVNCSSPNQIARSLAEAGDTESSTAEGGAGAADTIATIYTGSAVSSKPFRVVGFADFFSGLATPGTWNVDPDVVIDYRVGMPLAGQERFSGEFSTFSTGTGSTTVPDDNTIPQSSEGFLLTSATIASSPCNLVKSSIDIGFFYNADATIIASLFWGAGTNAKAARPKAAKNGIVDTFVWNHIQRLAVSGNTTWSVRMGGSVAGTFQLNGGVGGNLGGVVSSEIKVAGITG